MNLVRKLKEVSVSVVPILLIVVVMNFTITPLGWSGLLRFLGGGALIIVGLGLFLLGLDIGVVPVGQKVGSALVGKRNLALLLAAGFAVGFLVTVAEPDVRVLAAQVASVDPSISSAALVLMIGLGVGLFVAVGFGRVILRIPYRVLLVGFYAVVFILAAFADTSYLAVAFDAGGATTGPMTVPFIIALGVGVAAVRKGKEEDSFGLVGLASIGPIMAVLVLGIAGGGSDSASEVSESLSLGFLHVLLDTLGEVGMALAPLVVMFLAFHFTLIRLSARQLLRMVLGLVYSFAGLVAFFLGVNGSFLPIGSLVGRLAGSLPDHRILVPLGFILGAVVVLAEPAIWVLNGQVEAVSGGHIKKRVMLPALSIGVAAAVAIAMIRVTTGLSIWWFLVPGYALALALTFLCPPVFVAIAFDSGGVASGPMSSTFILAFTLGASEALGGNPIQDAFGVIAMIAMIPLIAIQVLGLVYKAKERRAELRNKSAKDIAHE